MRISPILPLLTVALVLGMLAPPSRAGNLNVQGDLSVASNLTATAVTLGGETHTNWPSGGTAGVTDLTSPVLDFSQSGQLFRYTLTNDTTWLFTNHVAGRAVWLQVAQDSTGGHQNTWPADLLWSSSPAATVTATPTHFSVFRILDNGTSWLAQPEGLDYSVPCTSNCSYALQSDGSQNYVTVPGFALTNADLTLEFWYKLPESTSAPWNICGAWPSNPGFQISFYGSPPSQFYCQSFAGVVYYNAWASLLDHAWHHYAFVQSDSTVTIWIDGTLRATGTASLRMAGGSNLSFGYDSCASEFGRGVFDEVRLSAVARYSSSFTPATSFTTDSDTVAYYKFDEGTGTTVYDETGNHNGTLQGSPVPEWVEGR